MPQFWAGISIRIVLTSVLGTPSFQSPWTIDLYNARLASIARPVNKMISIRDIRWGRPCLQEARHHQELGRMVGSGGATGSTVGVGRGRHDYGMERTHHKRREGEPQELQDRLGWPSA